MTDKFAKNLNIIAAGLIIVNLVIDLYDRFSRKKTGQSKNENTQPEDENDNDDDSTQDYKSEDDD